MASGPVTSRQIDMETVRDFILGGGGALKSLQMLTAAMKLKYTNLDSILKSRDITLLTKVRLVKAMVFTSSHVWM